MARSYILSSVSASVQVLSPAMGKGRRLRSWLQKVGSGLIFELGRKYLALLASGTWTPYHRLHHWDVQLLAFR